MTRTMLIDAAPPRTIGVSNPALRFGEAAKPAGAWAGQRLMWLGDDPAFELSYWCGASDVARHRGNPRTTPRPNDHAPLVATRLGYYAEEYDGFEYGGLPVRTIRSPNAFRACEVQACRR